MLDKKLQEIKGVGEKTALAFESAGLFTVNDIINFLPRKYEDYSVVQDIATISPGKISIRGSVEQIVTKRVRRGLHITEATIVDSSGKVNAIWFNQPYRADQLRKEKTQWLVSGQYSFQGMKYQITNPSVEKADSVHIRTGRIVPVYKAIKSVNSRTIPRLLHEILPIITMLDETLPSHVLKTEKLLSRADAIKAIHFPENMDALSKARTRLAFEELFSLVLAGQLNKQEQTQLKGYTILFDEAHAKKFVSQLPFVLTDSQRLAVWQIIQDFNSTHPMNRLLQGDVGSGKTVVAGMAASIAAQQGLQTAVLAPTEILANQHAETLHTLCEPFGTKVGLLTGNVKGAKRAHLYGAIENGDIDIIVGTHALLQDKVKYHKLGFVVIDEQHRFGVAQRQQLLKKSPLMPHLLSMTATPIPRSLMLALYGELSVSVLKERPQSRKPIMTEIVSPNSRESMYKKVAVQIEKGHQVYVVCPLIEDSEKNERKSVEVEYKKLKTGMLKKYRSGILHGQLSSEEKQQVMLAFKEHRIDILVSTTVVEVGVDVPNATIMIIENADQFGLAQAHQLRGRVGRSSHQSYCFLVSSDSLKPSKRLRELAKSNDGFYLSEVDLELRGPGEIYGRAQHGQLNLQLASINDTKLLERVQYHAVQFIKNKEDLLQYKELQAQVKKYQRITTLN